MRLRCTECSAKVDTLPPTAECPKCHGLLEADIGKPTLPAGWRDRPLCVWRYKEFLPHHADRAPITLGEGGTPLVEAPRLAKAIGVRRLHLKVEGQNPTGSFKDRGMTCAVSWSVHEGSTTLACASTGNTAASMAAFAARAGARAVVVLPAGQVAIGKVAQALAHGARVLEVEGSFDDAMNLVLDWAKTQRVGLMNSKNPLRLEGQKTLMFEILDQLDLKTPDRVVYPVGNAGNISAGHKGLIEYQAAGLIREIPRLTGVQAAGAAPLADAFARGAKEVRPVERPETFATAIRIGRPVSATKALRAVRDTDGSVTAVSDAAIQEAQRDLARLEGVLAEPASAASVAGLRALRLAGQVDAGESVVCVLTGHGLKDPHAAEKLATAPPRRIPKDTPWNEALL